MSGSLKVFLPRQSNYWTNRQLARVADGMWVVLRDARYGALCTYFLRGRDSRVDTATARRFVEWCEKYPSRAWSYYNSTKMWNGTYYNGQF